MGWGDHPAQHRDLSDGELRARLVQRDVALTEANGLVADRDDPDTAQVIARLLR